MNLTIPNSSKFDFLRNEQYLECFEKMRKPDAIDITFSLFVIGITIYFLLSSFGGCIFQYIQQRSPNSKLYTIIKDPNKCDFVREGNTLSFFKKNNGKHILTLEENGCTVSEQEILEDIKINEINATHRTPYWLSNINQYESNESQGPLKIQKEDNI